MKNKEAFETDLLGAKPLMGAMELGLCPPGALSAVLAATALLL